MILDKMRRCGYTPWSAVEAVRCIEDHVVKLTCTECKSRILAACVFLMECAAVEASRQRDWLVRNEAVIQLSWLLCHMHSHDAHICENDMQVWAESISIHSMRFQEYKTKAPPSDTEALVVMFAVDHIPFMSTKQYKVKYIDGGPEPEFLEVIERNKRFRSTQELVVYPFTKDVNFNMPPEVDKSPSYATEARAEDVEIISQALVTCFPRVAASALGDLTLKVPKERDFSGRSVRQCHQNMLSALQSPSSPRITQSCIHT